MPLPLSERNPTLHAEAVTAFERAQTASGNISQDIADVALSTVDMAAIIAARTKEAKEAGGLGGQEGLEVIANLETREAFERSFSEFTSLFERIGFTTPTPEEFASANPDILAHWSGVYERMQDNGLEPDVSIAPLADTSEWKALYANLQDDAAVNDDGRIKDGGLWMNEDVEANWTHLTDQTTSDILTAADGTKWIMQVNPGIAEAPNVDTVYTDTDIQMSPHAYLATQARRLAHHRPPLDTDGYSWLHGTFDSGAHAPSGYWGRDYGRVRVAWVGVSFRLGNLGSRSPVG